LPHSRHVPDGRKLFQPKFDYLLKVVSFTS
jgi:hypothetical protein